MKGFARILVPVLLLLTIAFLSNRTQGQVELVSGGSATVVFSATGDSALYVDGDTVRVYPGMWFKTDSSYLTYQIGVVDTFMASITVDSLYVLDSLHVGGANHAFVVTSDDKVGIGTASPSQELDLIGDIELESTTSNDKGVIYKGASRWIHDYHHPTGNTAVPDGFNIFIGDSAGNFTMGSTATNTLHASYNVGIGYKTLFSNTTGYHNIAQGYGALYSNTTGYEGIAAGDSAGYANTEGYGNIFLGSNAGDNITTGDLNIMIGYDIDAESATGNSQLNIGNTIYGDLANDLVGIGTATPYASLSIASDTTHFAIYDTDNETTHAAFGDIDSSAITGDFIDEHPRITLYAANGKSIFWQHNGSSGSIQTSTGDIVFNAGTNGQIEFYDTAQPISDDGGQTLGNFDRRWTNLFLADSLQIGGKSKTPYLVTTIDSDLGGAEANIDSGFVKMYVAAADSDGTIVLGSAEGNTLTLEQSGNGVITASAGYLNLDGVSGVSLDVNGSLQWYMSSALFGPTNDDADDLGAKTQRPKKIFASDELWLGGPAASSSARQAITWDSDYGTWASIDSAAILQYIGADSLPVIAFKGSDGDAWEQTMTTGDVAVFQNASGGYSFDAAINTNSMYITTAGELYYTSKSNPYIVFGTSSSSLYTGSNGTKSWNLDIRDNSSGADGEVRIGDTGTAGEYVSVDSAGVFHVDNIIEGSGASNLTIYTSAADHDIILDPNDDGPGVAIVGVPGDGDSLIVNASGPNFFADTSSVDDDYGFVSDHITAYTTGMVIYLNAGVANTGACTLQINALGAKSLKSLHDQDPQDNYIEAGSYVHLIYDGTNFQILSPDANP